MSPAKWPGPVPTAPPALRRGDTVAIVSPSSPAAARFPRRLSNAVAALADLDLHVRLMPHATDGGDPTAVPIADRVSDLEAAFADREVRAVITAIGGHFSSQLVSILDWDLIRDNPKIFCGFSDSTSLHLALLSHANLSSFYGPAALPNWGEMPAPHPETVSSFSSMAFGSPGGLPVLAPARAVVTDFRDWAEDGPRTYEQASEPREVRPGRAVGPLLPACLPVLCESIGTAWQPPTAGAILVLDLPSWPYDVGELASNLWHLRNAGLLDDIAMLMTTTPDARSNFGELPGLLDSAVPDPATPIAIDVAMGHSSPMLTVPIGRMARWERSSLQLLESPTSSSDRT